METNNQSAFRDLNKNGRLDPYEDPARPIDERVDDLLAQMSLEEKAGLMFHTILGVAADGSLAPAGFGGSPEEMVNGKLISHFNVHGLPAPRLAAEWHNRLQALAEATRLGIPATISSDPRHGFTNNPVVSLTSGGFSQWPEPIGLGAIGDAALTEQFGAIARQEYAAVGIRVALHPMADLATEPRWARINGTFGEDATRSAQQTAAYVRGFQGAALGPASVACMTKHFPGGGPQKDGEDPHFAYGREQVYPGDNFGYHLGPFEAAFAAGTSQIMPYYGMPVGLQYEEVGFGFNKEIVTGLLREHYGFDGVVCTDWGLINDAEILGKPFPARAWGVENLTPLERVHKALDAGVDQFGGEECPELIVELVRGGQLPESRIDASARRILREKFRLGLFDNPYVDPDAAEQVVGNAEFVAAGAAAQRRAFVLLKNGTDAAPVLPLAGRPRIYAEGVAPEVAGEYGELVGSPREADLAIVRLQAPFDPRSGTFLESFFHAGDLRFKPDVLGRLLALLAQVPTIVDIYLDRPAIIPELAAGSAALLANFGASDAALLDVLFGRAAPGGTLPFELPSSQEAVLRQRSDVPFDTGDPLFPFGFGLRYSAGSEQ